MNEIHAFNSDQHVQSEIKKLIETFNIKHVVETGTFVGNSTAFFSKCGCVVDTIEINQEYYNSALINLENYDNFTCHLGDSIQMLPRILETIPKELTLFYLDAHWQDDWPLLNEIELIGKSFKDNCILVIDDFFVPNRNLQYDVYKDIKNDINFIKNSLDHVYTDPVYYYNNRAESNGNLYMKECYGVGKIYIFSKELLLNSQVTFYETIDGENYSVI
jgi:predicted O-methyltransferase YrrM